MYHFIFSSPEHRVLSELMWSLTIRRCPSVGVHPSVCPQFSCLHTIIHKYQQINTRLGQNVYDYKISDEFYYGTNLTRTIRVVCPWIRKFAIFDFVWLCLPSNVCKCWPISTKLGHNIYARKISDKLDYGSNWIRKSGVICPWIWKNCWTDFVYTLSSKNINQSAPNLVKMYVTI